MGMLANNSCTDQLDNANSSEGKPDLVVDQDQHYEITLKIEGKADRTGRCIFIRGCEVF